MFHVFFFLSKNNFHRLLLLLFFLAMIAGSFAISGREVVVICWQGHQSWPHGQQQPSWARPPYSSLRDIEDSAIPYRVF